MNLKKLILAVAMLACVSTAKATCTQYFGYAQQGGQTVNTAGYISLTTVQRSFPGSTVTVYQTGTTTKVALFSDSACSASVGNPLTASSSDASFSFYTTSTTALDFTFSGTGITTGCGGAGQLPCQSTFTWTGQLSGGSSGTTTTTVLSVKDYGAKGDGQTVTDGSINNGSATLTSSTAPFVAGDVGKSVYVAGAGAAGVQLVTTIAGFTSATTVTLSATASTSVTGAKVIWGTEDASAVQSTINACPSGGSCVVYFPVGDYLLDAVARGGTQVHINTSNITIRGDGLGSRLHRARNDGASDSTVRGVLTIMPITASISNITVQNLQILGPVTNTGAYRPSYVPNVVSGITIFGDVSAVTTYETFDVHISNVLISGMDGTGIALGGNALGTGGVHRTVIDGVTIKSGRGEGINALGASVYDTRITNCTISDIDSHGIDWGGSGLQAIGNIITNVRQNAISLTGNTTAGYSDTHETQIIGNLIYNVPQTTGTVVVGNGIYLDAEGGVTVTQNIKVQSNVISFISGYGIVGPATATYKNIHIVGNVVHDIGSAAANTYDGITFLTTPTFTNSSIIGNTVTTNGASYSMHRGIYLNAGDPTVTVQANSIDGASTADLALSFNTVGTNIATGWNNSNGQIFLYQSPRIRNIVGGAMQVPIEGDPNSVSGVLLRNGSTESGWVRREIGEDVTIGAANTERFRVYHSGGILNNQACKWLTGAGAPNGVVTGNVCDLYTNTTGGAGTTFYVKESGTATNTGWVGK